MLLMIDNYDSFTYNLVQEIQTIARVEVTVVRNDAASAAELVALAPTAIVVSPGPGAPADAGVTEPLIAAAGHIPLLGICLGHQALAEVHGARVVRAPAPVHGKTSAVHHAGQGLFAGLPSPFAATRYHSLVVERSSLVAPLEVTAWSEDGLVMGLACSDRPHYGVQFHPESYLTVHGMALLANFLTLAGVEVGAAWRAGAAR
jgi:anthranilate synthase/aminodeoxychorismate synthase-like glutamine amidotransferase